MIGRKEMYLNQHLCQLLKLTHEKYGARDTEMIWTGVAPPHQPRVALEKSRIVEPKENTLHIAPILPCLRMSFQGEAVEKNVAEIPFVQKVCSNNKIEKGRPPDRSSC